MAKNKTDVLSTEDLLIVARQYDERARAFRDYLSVCDLPSYIKLVREWETIAGILYGLAHKRRRPAIRVRKAKVK